MMALLDHSVEFCKGARQSGLVSVWQHTLVASNGKGFCSQWQRELLRSCSTDVVFILGMGYLYLRVLRLRTGEVCCKRTRQQIREPETEVQVGPALLEYAQSEFPLNWKSRRNRTPISTMQNGCNLK